MDIRKNHNALNEEELAQYSLLSFLPSMKAFVKYKASETLVGEYYMDWIQGGEWYEPRIKKRIVSALVLDTTECIIGSFVLRIYSPSTLISDEEFLYLMDRDEGYEYRLATVLTDLWPELAVSLSDYGDIIEVYGVWYNSAKTSALLMREAIESVMSDFDKSEYSIQIVNASALKLDDTRGSEKEQLIWFNAQRAELKRTFREDYKFSDLPNNHGADGWMWKPNPDKENVIGNPSS